MSRSQYPGSALSSLLLLLAGVFLGLVVGYFLMSPGPPTAHDVSPVVQPEPTGQANPPAWTGSLNAGAESSFGELEREAIRLLSERDYAAALERLLEADLLARTEAEARQLSSLLEEAVRLRVDQLRSMDRLGEIDALYETLTLTMPERAEYFLLLGEHRIDTHHLQGALSVLAQIENHHQLGGRARALIEEITAPDPVEPLAVIPLQRSGDQYQVRVQVDGRRYVSLLLDTGAAISVIRPAILRDLGYDLRAETGRFLTAGGQVQAPVVWINQLAVDSEAVSGLRVGALDLATDPGQVDGLLGMDFLRHFRFRVDQDAGTLVLDARRGDPGE
ncbi:MAG: retropepsin-like aspartic protease [Proteobacteria bacterium]|nr:retropepsin-like aspartic protease [Pseudomonadota bacterium]